MADLPVRASARYAVPASRVFAAWTAPAIARDWLFATATRPALDVRIDARPGGRLRIVEQHRRGPIVWPGRVEHVVPPWRLAFVLGIDDALTRVDVRIAAAPGGCELALVHSGLPPDRRAQFAGRWAGMLYGLGTLLDSIAEPVALP